MKKIFDDATETPTGMNYPDYMKPTVCVKMTKGTKPTIDKDPLMEEFTVKLSVFTTFRSNQHLKERAKRTAMKNLNNYLFGDVMHQLQEILQATYGSDRDRVICLTCKLLEHLEKVE